MLLVALLLGVTAATLPGCTVCHRSAKFVVQTAQSAHAKIACARCHVEPGVATRVVYAYHLVFGMTLQLEPVSSGPVAGITNSTCLSCHQNVMKRVVNVNGLSIDHSKCSKGRLCTDCHSQTAHGTAVQWASTPEMNQCLDCHASAKVRSNCNTCHVGRTVQERVRTGEWIVTHGPSWKTTHGMGDLKTCVACHPDNYCVQCHGMSLPHDSDFIRTHPTQALSQRKDCDVCHKQTFCDDCHGLQMPHPASFTPAHSSIVKKQGSTVCLRCHVEDDCTKCHEAHVHPGGATKAPSA